MQDMPKFHSEDLLSSTNLMLMLMLLPAGRGSLYQDPVLSDWREFLGNGLAHKHALPEHL